MHTVCPILHLFVVTAKTIIEGVVEATHKGFNTTMVEANLEVVAMVEVTLKAVADAVAEAVAEAEVEDMLRQIWEGNEPFPIIYENVTSVSFVSVLNARKGPNFVSFCQSLMNVKI